MLDANATILLSSELDSARREENILQKTGLRCQLIRPEALVHSGGRMRYQSHFGAKPKSVRRPFALPRAKIWSISSSDNAKSKISMFSDSRSTREVRGMAHTFCCTSQRRQIWAGVLPCSRPISFNVSSFLILPLATGL